jgi:uncharacterized OsmC-like protein
MSEPMYVSQVHIEGLAGHLPLVATLPNEPAPVYFGLHGPLAKHFGVNPEEGGPHAATLDYVVASAAGCLIGTLGVMLTVRKVDTSGNRLTADVRGEIELEDNVPVIRRIHIVYQIAAPAEFADTIQRVHDMHAKHCPVYRSLQKSIDITTSYNLKEI